MKILFVLVSLLLSVSIYFFSIWLDKSIFALNRANEKYINNIRKAKKIQDIDIWLREKVSSKLKQVPVKTKDAELNLINFFDKYSDIFNLKVKKYIYNEGLAKHLGVTFDLPRNNKKKLEQFFTTTFPNGYISYKTLDIGKDVTGYIDIIQPVNEEKKKIKKRVEDVPQ